MTDTPVRQSAAKAARRADPPSDRLAGRGLLRPGTPSRPRWSGCSTSVMAAAAASISATRFPRLFDLIDDEPDRRGRRRRQGRLRQGRRSLHALRHVLHDQMPLRAAAPVQRRFSASDAAPPRRQAQGRRRRTSSRDQLGETDRNGKLAAPVARPGQLGDRAKQRPVRGARWKRALGIDRDAPLPRYHAKTATRPAGDAAGGRPGRPGVRPAQGGALRHLLRRLQHSPRPAAAAAAVLAKQGVETRLAYPGCCGMPQLESRRPRRGGRGAPRRVAAALRAADRLTATTSSRSPPAAG